MQSKLSDASYGLSALLVWMGTWNWPIVSMALGCVLGILTFIINWRYQAKKLRILEDAAKRGYLSEPKSELWKRD